MGSSQAVRHLSVKQVMHRFDSYLPSQPKHSFTYRRTPMLPFLASKKIVSVISAKRKAQNTDESDMHMAKAANMMDSELSPPELLIAAHELIHAVHSKDAQAVADALEQAFYICESYPHQESEIGEE